MKTRISIRMRAFALFVCLLLVAFTAIAKDKTVSTITIPDGCRTPDAIVYNGASTGTIQILYTHVGTTFPAGDFACFRLGMTVADSTGSQDPKYPVNVLVEQIGGDHVILTPGTTTLVANGIAQPVGGSPVDYNVAINPLVPTIPELNEDGDTLVGNLRISASDNRLETVTNILVKILLVHPSATQCLKTYHEVLNNDTLATLSSIIVKKGGGPNSHKVNNSDPPVILDSVLVANTCPASYNVDEKIILPSGSVQYFELGSAGNPLMLYTKLGALDASGIATIINAPDSTTPKGTALCLQNISLPAGYSILTTAQMKIIKDTLLANLPATPPGFVFEGSFWAPSSACGTALSDPPASLFTVNPIQKALPYTIE